jgi:DNA transposition AAA+ family ATPase
MKTNEEKQQIIASLRENIAKTGISAAKMAVQLGISPALLSNMFSGKWEQISEEKWALAASFAQPLPQGWALVETANFNTIRALANHCAQNSLMRCVVGYSGAGKTTALTHIARNSPNAFYVLAQESMTRKEFVEAILEAIGVEFAGTINKMLKKVASEIVKRPGALLMIDDAGKLSGSKLHVIQQLYDLTENRAGILISAVDYFYDNLVKASVAGKMGYPELQTRIGYKQKLAAPSSAEKAAIATANCPAGPPDGSVLREIKDFRTLYNTIQSHNKKEAI